jgi:transposase InsO family protein
VLRRPVEPGQFRPNAFVRTLRSNGLVGSTGRVGACGDNSATESFFALVRKNGLDASAGPL